MEVQISATLPWLLHPMMHSTYVHGISALKNRLSPVNSSAHNIFVSQKIGKCLLFDAL